MKKVYKSLHIAQCFFHRILGKASEEESQTLKEWIRSHQKATDEIYAYDHNARKEQIAQINTEEAYLNLQTKLRQANHQPAPAFPPLLKYAAVVVLFSVLGMAYFYNKQQAVQIIVKETPRGGVPTEIQLPDGTQVWLSVDSKLSYPSSFSDASRQIQLQGEAYFEVTQDKQRPFSVTSGELVTTALGTSFNIRAYDADRVQVSLRAGKVEVKKLKTDKKMVLSPGEQLNAAPSGWKVKKFKREEVLAWKIGVIHFDQTPFDEVLGVLERRYDVSFVIKNLTPAQRKELEVTGSFQRQSLAQVLRLLSHSTYFTYTKKQKTITITFNSK